MRTTLMISLRNITKTYRRGSESVRVLDRLDLDVDAGELCAVMGPSGSGKSTLLHLIGGLDRADSGTIEVAGQELGALDENELARWRAETVGFIFQGFHLIPVLTALENVELPLLHAPLSRRRRREQARYALEIVGLADRMRHRPSQLSGGQEQRVAIARAIVTDPKLILADEPTGDLDRAWADQILELLVRLSVELGKALIIVTHDPLAAARARRTIQLDKGRLSGAGLPAGALGLDSKSDGRGAPSASSGTDLGAGLRTTEVRNADPRAADLRTTSGSFHRATGAAP
jgi:putative ABC transport system ATP-binding protein